ncbi:baseplate J/gp47 family protein [uncultured Phocaeicola sp.]|uniref:baseplate J/gp47 family protein n=2 Tax=Bacteria TaxID=2 RepID=UPI0025AEA84B|nr:baseplate J/gp47 family protein [uncultured Phocaeicola sp.]
MIDKNTLDAILPIPDLEELKDANVEKLKQEGFVITNFHSGGVFYTILMIVLWIRIELTGLLRTVINHCSVSHATGLWLDIKAADFSKKRKRAQKARGYVTVSRAAVDGEAVKIPKGTVFKTVRDINGEDLRFFSLEPAVLQKGTASVDVLVEAEAEGSRYNVPEAQIASSLTYLGDVAISNRQGWIAREGSDTESDEGLRRRCLRSWAELATVAIHDTYVNVCESVNGVLYATVKDQHPRGQGTIDVIITSEAGNATEALLNEVRAACEKIKAPDDDVLVKSAETVYQPVALTVTVPSVINQTEIEGCVASAVTDLLRIRQRRELNELTHADLIHKVKSAVPSVRNVTVTIPETDIFLDADKIILPSTISITVQGV